LALEWIESKWVVRFKLGDGVAELANTYGRNWVVKEEGSFQDLGGRRAGR
jgi:hypothetical protein